MLFLSLAKSAMALARRFAEANRGATAVEYGLILALVVLAVVAAIHQTATVTVQMWNDTSNKVQAAH